MDKKETIANEWLNRYTGTEPKDYGDWILLTNFQNYVEKFSEKFNCVIKGSGGPMTSSTNDDGLSIINFGIGSSNAATIMDLLSAISPKGVLFLGKCGGLKKTTEIGHFILPTAAIRGEGTSDDYFPKEVPAMPSFKLHKYVSELLERPINQVVNWLKEEAHSLLKNLYLITNQKQTLAILKKENLQSKELQKD